MTMKAILQYALATIYDAPDRVTQEALQNAIM